MYLPTFTITNKILANIGRIEAAKEVIENAPLIPAWEATFRKEAIIRTVHHGTHIEGNELDYSQAERVVEVAEGDRHVTSATSAAKESGVVARDRDIQEVLNYRNVLSFIERFQKSIDKKQFIGRLSSENDHIIESADGKLTEDVLLHIQKLTVEKIFMPHECGLFRKTQVVIKNSRTGEVTFRPPPAIEVPYLIRDFLKWLNETSRESLHSVLKAGIVHYELVRIHPFLDGNGRASRASALLLLFLDGYDIKRFFSLEEYYDKDPMEYYHSLQEVEKKEGNLTSWLEYFSQGIAIELNNVKEKVKSLSRDIKLKQDLGGKQVALTERQLKLIEHIQKIGFLQNKMFFEIEPMVSEDTILRDLKDLIDKGIIEKKGRTKGARYVLRK